MATVELTKYLEAEIESNPFLNKIDNNGGERFVMSTSINDYSNIKQSYKEGYTITIARMIINVVTMT